MDAEKTIGIVEVAALAASADSSDNMGKDKIRKKDEERKTKDLGDLIDKPWSDAGNTQLPKR